MVMYELTSVLNDLWTFLFTSISLVIGATLLWFLAAGFYKVVIKRFVYKGTKFTNSVKETKDDNGRKLRDSSTICAFPECIRCTRHREILARAATRLSYYSQVPSSLSGSDRRNTLNSLITDITVASARLRSVLKEDAENSQPMVFHLSGLRETKVWSKHDFPDLQLLEISYSRIKSEFLHLFSQIDSEVVGHLWKHNETEGGRWSVLPLVDQGHMTKAADLCPHTMATLKGIPYVMRDNVFGDVSFSVVHPGTVIPTHCGATNMRIRCHLGLQVPSGEVCQLEVAGESVAWQEGDVLCFNDAHPHSVRHKGEEEFRAVLIVDIWHPDITEHQKEVLSYTFST